MKRIFGVIVQCPRCEGIHLVPLFNLRLQLVNVLETPRPFEMAVTDGGEGPETENEILETPTETHDFQTSRPFSVMKADGFVN